MRFVKTGLVLLLSFTVVGSFGTALQADGARVHLAKVGMSMLSNKQKKEMWVMVGRFAQIEIILESCQRRSNIQRRIIRVASPCVERRTLKKVRRNFRNKLAYYRKRIVALDCQSKEVKALLKAGKKAVDQVVDHVRKQCNACFFC